MTRRFCNGPFLATAIFLAAQFFVRADSTNMLSALAKSAVLENNVVYLRVAEIETNLPQEIESAQNRLAATNKIAGTILDLRFADGSDLDSAKATENLFVQKKLPLAILVNGETLGMAATLASDLRGEKAGLIFGSATKNLQPDVPISASPEDEWKFLENPYGTLSQSKTNSATNNFLAFVDHTSEADLVRAKIKDGDEDENPALEQPAEPPKPFIRDPVLARAVDLIKALEIVREKHS